MAKHLPRSQYFDFNASFIRPIIHVNNRPYNVRQIVLSIRFAVNASKSVPLSIFVQLQLVRVRQLINI